MPLCNRASACSAEPLVDIAGRWPGVAWRRPDGGARRQRFAERRAQPDRRWLWLAAVVVAGADGTTATATATDDGCGLPRGVRRGSVIEGRARATAVSPSAPASR